MWIQWLAELSARQRLARNERQPGGPIEKECLAAAELEMPGSCPETPVRCVEPCAGANRRINGCVRVSE